ncbi:MAG: hypothetical protein QGI68_12260 [Pseudomonadales bacterium]|jgi:hypothetical protein|nr:hypothetical protein [Pseudomonadales bacterium]MDP7596324.1 hypothetical protein [Pseudomonadales bacterium]HJN49999.1 hypothetical protein [Pseudomonadales bacterium]|tara:strand:+ start:844 stop:1104 length:261 start_codon:yes stop_codon:yes gene_type:complete
MKEKLMGSLAVLVINISSICLILGPIAVYAQDMFIPEDTDQYSPGIGIGETFPNIRARQGQSEKRTVNEFMGTKGLVVYMNRSVDW